MESLQAAKPLKPSQRRVFVLALCSLVLCVGLTALFPHNAWGASAKNSKYLTAETGESVTYKKIDVNRDRTADEITLSVESQKVRIFVNGKSAFSFKPTGEQVSQIIADGADLSSTIRIMQMSGGRAFVYFLASVEGTGLRWEYVLTYRGGKLTKALNPNKLTARTGAFRHYVSGIKAKGNRIVIHHSASASKFIEARYTYKYSNGKLTRTSKTGTWLGSKKVESMRDGLPVYKSAKCKSVATRLSEGQTARVSKIYLNGGRAILKVKTSSGKTGWVKLTNNSLSPLTVL